MVKMRKRLAVACDACRSRRVKCDGQRPSCVGCLSRGLDCSYQRLPEPPATRLETELANVNMRLDYLAMLLSRQSQPQAPPPVLLASARPSSNPLSSHEDSPFRLLATDSIMSVLGLEDHFARRLVQLERASLLASTTSLSRMFFISHQQVTDALIAFSERVHTFYPILPLDFSERYFATLSGPLAPSCQTCLALLVAAIGCIARDPTMGDEYFEAALASLPTVLAECTLASIQCLVFLSIYYCCRLKPCQAHDYCLIASFKIQNLFKSELSVQLDVATSDTWKLDEYIPLPNCRYTWQFACPPLPGNLAGVSPESASSSSSSISIDSTNSSTSTASDQAQSFFLAEIAMRRMLHRCNSAVAQSSDGRFCYAPSIALELERQLEEWYDYLPASIRFVREPAGGSFSGDQSALSPLSTFLNVQYCCCKLSIYWPAVYQVIQDDKATPQLLEHCQRFTDSYVQLLPRIALAIDKCLIYKWTLSVTFFVTTMAALKVANTAALRAAQHERLHESLALAGTVGWKNTEDSPSLELLRLNLSQHLREAKQT
ncbi:hypothetical protein BDW60DRAFT_221475 [Aspergillus nidulans var. acristatus]